MNTRLLKRPFKGLDRYQEDFKTSKNLSNSKESA